jgi:hypothetical protein
MPSESPSTGPSVSSIPSDIPSFFPSLASSASPSIFYTDNPDYAQEVSTGSVNCLWVAQAKTISRCQRDGMLANCRATCDPQCTIP